MSVCFYVCVMMILLLLLLFVVLLNVFIVKCFNTDVIRRHLNESQLDLDNNSDKSVTDKMTYRANMLNFI